MTSTTGRTDAAEVPGSATEEPGAQDNQFMCNPNEAGFEPVTELEDGKRYRITMIASQGGPGNFTVEKVESAEPVSEDGEAAPAESAEGEAPEDKEEYDNPAVAALAAGPKS